MIGDINYKGKEYGKVAFKYLLDYGFEKLNLQKINLAGIEDNIPAVNLYIKFGFKIEGVFKREVCISGIFHNVLSMAKFKKI